MVRAPRGFGGEVRLVSQPSEGKSFEEVWPEIAGLAPDNFIGEGNARSPAPGGYTGIMGRWEEDRVAAAERGENPTVLTRLKTGWAVIGDTQHLPGYCLLLYCGEANHLTDLTQPTRADFLLDMSLLGEAVQSVCRARDPQFRRVNYEVLGNSWPHLHAHVHPRYEWEPYEHRNKPVWTYPDRKDARYRLDDRHTGLRGDLARELNRITAEAYGTPIDDTQPSAHQ